MKSQDLNLLHKAYLEDPLKVGEEFASSLWHFCRKMVRKKFKRSFPQYKDCIGEAVHYILLHIQDFQGRSLFTTWVSKIVLTECKKARRREAESKECQLFEYVDLEESKGPSLSERLMLDKLLHQLEADERELIHLKFDGFENKEIAQTMGVSEKRIEGKYTEIVKKMRVLALKST